MFFAARSYFLWAVVRLGVNRHKKGKDTRSLLLYPRRSCLGTFVCCTERGRINRHIYIQRSENASRRNCSAADYSHFPPQRTAGKWGKITEIHHNRRYRLRNFPLYCGFVPAMRNCNDNRRKSRLYNRTLRDYRSTHRGHTLSQVKP